MTLTQIPTRLNIRNQVPSQRIIMLEWKQTREKSHPSVFDSNDTQCFVFILDYLVSCGCLWDLSNVTKSYTLASTVWRHIRIKKHKICAWKVREIVQVWHEKKYIHGKSHFNFRPMTQNNFLFRVRSCFQSSCLFRCLNMQTWSNSSV